MAGAKAPHQGYNHNVRHMGHVFHVQTEDSGGRNPHIETHVYYEGVILASKRTPYADFLNDPNPDTAIRRLMQDQHKELLKDLRSGAMDDKISDALAKHEKKKPHLEPAPSGAKPPPDGKSSTGDLPVAAPPDPRPRRPPTPVPVARPPVARPPRGDHGAGRQSGVIVARPVHVVEPGTRPVAARGGGAPKLQPIPSVTPVSTTPPPSGHSADRTMDLDALILRFLIEDLERGD